MKPWTNITRRMREQNITLVEYTKIHYWLKKNYGKATKCSNTLCKKISTRYEWALKPAEKYDYNVKNFHQLCHSCHMIQDSKQAENYCRNGHLYIEKNLYVSPRGIRCYRTCLYNSNKKWREAHAERRLMQKKIWDAENQVRWQTYRRKAYLRRKELGLIT